MDTQHIETLLRQDAERFDTELEGLDTETFTATVLTRLGLEHPAPAPGGEHEGSAGPR